MARLGRRQPNRPIVYRPRPVPAGRAAPTLIAYSDIAFNAVTTPRNTAASFTWQTGDFFVVIGGTADQVATITAVDTAGANLTFAAGAPITTASSCWANTWTATASGAGSGTIRGTSNSGGNWGIAVWQFRGSDGLGARSAQASVAVVQSLTSTQDNSAVCEGLFDWAAISPTGHGWTPAGQTERQAGTVAGQYSYYVADWGDQGAAGTTSYGITGITPTQNFTKIAVEVLGTSGGGATPISLTDSGAGSDTLSVAVAAPLADSGIGSDTFAISAAAPLVETGTGSDSLAAVNQVALADSGIGSDTLNVGLGVNLADAGTGSDALSVAVAAPLADSGIGSDTLAVTAAVPLVQTGTGSDALSVAAAAPLTDSGIGADTLTAGIAITLADTGVGAETLSVLHGIALSDSGTGSEALSVTAAVALAEAGAAAELLAVAVTLQLVDSGAGSDALLLPQASIPGSLTLATTAPAIRGSTSAGRVGAATASACLNQGSTSAHLNSTTSGGEA